MRFIAMIFTGAMFLALSPAHAEEMFADLPGVPLVWQIEQLQALPPIRLESGWVVRLAVGDSGGQGGPWMVLYCLAEAPVGGGDRLEVTVLEVTVTGNPLGPVAYVMMREGEALHGMGLGHLIAPVPRQALFATVVPVEAGLPQVLMIRDGRRFIARQRLEPRHAPPRQWARLMGGREARILRDTSAYAPSWDGFHPLDVTLPEQPGEITPRTVPGENRLPLGVPTQRRWLPENQQDIEISSIDSQLVITGDALILDPEEWLARWWVDGRPALAPRDPRDLHQLEQQIGRAAFVDRIALDLVFPAHLGELRPGQRVSVQVMRSVGGIQPMHDRMAMDLVQLADTALPLVSNRIEFELTEELLATARRNAQRQAAE